MTDPVLFLDEAAVRRLLSLEELIPVITQGLIGLSAGKVVQPIRVIVPVPEHQGFFGLMPAYTGSLGAKLVTFYPNNRGLPTHHALIVLFNPGTGEPSVVMDGRLITELRTAAASAAATQALARSDASTLAILGSGVQAGSHLEALRLVRPISEVRVWSPHKAGEFAARYQVTAAPSAEAAVRGADIIVVATSATTPVLEGRWISAGAHVNAVGATRPNWRELDDEALTRSRLFVDSREASQQESGDVMASGGIEAEIGEVLGGLREGRRGADEITLFKSVGVAVEDLVAADLVYQKATRDGSGSPPRSNRLRGGSHRAQD